MDTRTSYATASLLGNFNFYNFKDSLMNVAFWLNTPRRLYIEDKRLYERSLGLDKLLLLDDGYYLPSTIKKDIIGAIPNGIPCVNYELHKKKKQLLFVGRLVHMQKNTRFLMQLWRKIYADFPDWEFVICGEGQDMPVMKEYVKKHKIERVVFEGRVNPTQYYKDSSILLLPSFYEGFPMVLLECMQYGCVPIVFDVISAYHKICLDKNRPNSDGTPRKCGSIVKAMDKRAYVAECRHLMTDNELRKKMAIASIEHVKDYDIEKITDVWEKLFEELTSIVPLAANRKI